MAAAWAASGPEDSGAALRRRLEALAAVAWGGAAAPPPLAAVTAALAATTAELQRLAGLADRGEVVVAVPGWPAQALAAGWSALGVQCLVKCVVFCLYSGTPP